MNFLRACRASSTVAAAGAATAALAYQEGQQRGSRRARCDAAAADMVRVCVRVWE